MWPCLLSVPPPLATSAALAPQLWLPPACTTRLHDSPERRIASPHRTGKARRYGVETSFEVKTVQSLFQLSADGLTKLLERFHELDTSHDGTLGIDEFVSALALHETSRVWTQRLFSFFDTDASGSISYAEVSPSAQHLPTHAVSLSNF